jgi:hypothetical protein
MSTTSREEQGMSITEKLAHIHMLLRQAARMSIAGKQCYVVHPEITATEWLLILDTLQAAQSTPAGEVTADAVTANALAAYTLAWDAKKNPFDCMQAALAAALPALVKDKERLDFLDAKRAAFIGGYGLRCQSYRNDIDKEIQDAATAQANKG